MLGWPEGVGMHELPVALSSHSLLLFLLFLFPTHLDAVLVADEECAEGDNDEQ